jgi:hypothetical protein
VQILVNEALRSQNMIRIRQLAAELAKLNAKGCPFAMPTVPNT